MIRKIKFEKISNPRKCDKSSMGFGKTAMIRNTIGRRSQAMEFLMDIEFLRRLSMIIRKKNNDAIDIKICNLVMCSPSES